MFSKIRNLIMPGSGKGHSKQTDQEIRETKLTKVMMFGLKSSVKTGKGERSQHRFLSSLHFGPFLSVFHRNGFPETSEGESLWTANDAITRQTSTHHNPILTPISDPSPIEIPTPRHPRHLGPGKQTAIQLPPLPPPTSSRLVFSYQENLLSPNKGTIKVFAKPLGSGSFGVVYSIKKIFRGDENGQAGEGGDVEEIGETYALKVARNRKQHRLDADLKFLNYYGRANDPSKSPFIVAFHGLLDQVGIVLELSTTGDLDNFHRSRLFQTLLQDPHRQPELWSLMKYLLCQAISALDYLERVGIVWRDLKLENFLIGENGSIKASDFGGSAKVDEFGVARMWTLEATTISHLAPGFFIPQQVSNGYEFTTRTDLFSLGSTAIQMLSGQPARPYEKSLPNNSTRDPFLVDYYSHDRFSSTYPFNTPNPLSELIKALLDPADIKTNSGSKSVQRFSKHAFFSKGYETKAGVVWSEPVDWEKVNREQVETPNVMRKWMRIVRKMGVSGDGHSGRLGFTCSGDEKDRIKMDAEGYFKYEKGWILGTVKGPKICSDTVSRRC